MRGQAPSNLYCAKLARSINSNRIVLHVEGDKVSSAEMIIYDNLCIFTKKLNFREI